MILNRREQVLDAARKYAGRVAKPVLGPQHGYRYLARRTIANQLMRGAVAGPGPDVPECRLDEIPARVPGARVHEVHSPWSEPIPPLTIHHRRPGVERAQPIPREVGLPAMRVFEIPGGAVFGSDGWIGPDRHTMARDLPTLYAPDDRDRRRRGDLARQIGLTELSGTTFSLLQQSNGNYAHWLLQGVPRVDLVRSVLDLASFDRVLVNARFATPLEAVLRRHGVGSDRIVRVEERAPVFVCEHLVAATPLPDIAAAPDWALRFWRAEFLDPAASAGGPERLLVVRPGAVRRQIVNGSEVVGALTARGFTAAAMEDHTAAEQAALFAGADVIVAEHGAALANLVYARPGTRVVELMPVNVVNWVYPPLGGRLGLDHHVILGVEPTLPARWWSWQIDADQIVDLDVLVELTDRS